MLLLLNWMNEYQEATDGTPYSQDLRDRVPAAYIRGMRTKDIGIFFRG